MLAWALPSILLIYLTRAIIHDLGWALTDGGIAVLAPAASSHASPAALGADLRCPVVCCLAFDDPQGLQRLRQLVDGGHVEAVVLMGIPPDRRDAVLDRVAELPVGIFLSTQPSTAHAMLHDVVESLPNLLTGRTGLAKRARAPLSGVERSVRLSRIVAEGSGCRPTCSCPGRNPAASCRGSAPPAAMPASSRRGNSAP